MAAIHGMATAGIPITHFADTTTSDTTVTMVGITGTTDTGRVTGFMRCVLQIVVVGILPVKRVPQLQVRVKIRTADAQFLPRVDRFLEPQRLIREWRQIVPAQASHPEISPVPTQATSWLAPAERWRRRVSTRSRGLRHLRRTGERQPRKFDKTAAHVLSSHRQAERTVP